MGKKTDHEDECLMKMVSCFLAGMCPCLATPVDIKGATCTYSTSISGFLSQVIVDSLYYQYKIELLFVVIIVSIMLHNVCVCVFYTRVEHSKLTPLPVCSTWSSRG